ncbi:MAG TPA: ATP-binding protein [Clostridia bacterium]|nr:ATP-binding protein [Clostridia bacterium]HQM38998.1 ATP-binding protein [Clostridia bacterium]
MNKILDKPFFIKIVLLVLTILIISLIITTIIYTVTSKEIFVNYQLERLKEETDMLASLIPEEWMTKDQLEQFFNKVFQAESTILRSYVVISDKLNVEVYSYAPDLQKSNYVVDKNDMDKFYKQTLSPYVRKVLTGQYITMENSENEFNSDMIIIMRPIFSQYGSVEAVLTICKFIDDYSDELNSINKTLILTMIGVALLMLYPVYKLSKSITKPLVAIRDVAIAFGKGDFTVRADESYPAEIGQLSITMNHLSSQLSKTISSLTRETNVLQGVLNSMNEGILVVDDSLSPIIINPAITKLFNSIINEHDKYSIIPLEEVWNDFRQCLSSKTGIENTYEIDSNMILCVIKPLSVNDSLVGAMGIFTDITKEVRLEQTRRDYVANVSHELKTPLTGVMGLLAPLKDGIVTDSDKINKYYEMMSNELHRLNRLINDLLTLSRLQSSAEAFAIGKVGLTDIIFDKVEKYHFSYNEENVRIDFKYTSSPVYVYGNSDRIEQILTILIDNAIKFSKPSTDKTINIKIDILNEDSKYIVSVQDFGNGISKEDLPYVFDRFYKSDKARSGAGSGLGLSIARETLKRMNESIWVESDGYSGSTFHFTLTKYTDIT